MRGTFNDCLRWLIRLGVLWLGLGLFIVERIRIGTFFWNQERLRKRYGIASTTPVLNFGSELEQLISGAALRAGRSGQFAFTSGSTASPKRILYTRRRLRAVKIAFTDVFARCCWSTRTKRTSLYVFSSFNKDDSLTSLLLEEGNCPPYLSSLQAPYRLQGHPAIQTLVSFYGPTAVRLWFLAIANPGVLYSTNPSTLSIFLDEIETDWPRSSLLIRDWYRQPEAFDAVVHRISKRLESRGSSARLELIAKSEAPLPLKACAPAVATYICWVGGYVKPFVDRLKGYLPSEHYRLIPMYSMSTETLETVTHFERHTISFLPIASRVLYEFIEQGREDDPRHLLTANQLQVGKNYSLVVSDSYGLRRYQTGDLFQCRGFVDGLPDLHFAHRRDLEYSFTGEKLTSEHVNAAFLTVREEYPELGPEVFLACLPSQPPSERIPHYKTVLINAAGVNRGVSYDELAERCDQLFSTVNREYQNKRNSGRLGRVRVVQMSLRDFIKRTSGSQRRHGWESQFKFLPLYRSTWESFDDIANPSCFASDTKL
jgi:hypothetical protein